MSVNKYNPHVWVIPEDDADRQLANGFQNHYAVEDQVVDVRSPAGGWAKVLDVFSSEYLPLLRAWPKAHVVLLIDFDNMAETRRVHFETNIPEGVRDRVFVIGVLENPESLRKEFKMSLEKIGEALAGDCLGNDFQRWNHPHLTHNSHELQRMVKVVKPFLFSVH